MSRCFLCFCRIRVPAFHAMLSEVVVMGLTVSSSDLQCSLSRQLVGLYGGQKKFWYRQGWLASSRHAYPRWAEWYGVEALGFCHVLRACHQSFFSLFFSVNLKTLLAYLCWFFRKFVKPVLCSIIQEACFMNPPMFSSSYLTCTKAYVQLHATTQCLALLVVPWDDVVSLYPHSTYECDVAWHIVQLTLKVT